MTDLPPELKAQQAMMDMVLGAMNAAPQTSKRQIDIEKAIMSSPMDYLTASEIFAALYRRLEQRYDHLDPQVEQYLYKLSRAFDRIT